MAVNRFSRPAQVAKFDPTGLDQLLKVRHVQQAREDATLNETREWLKDMYNTTHTEADSEKVNTTRQQYEAELEGLAEEIRKGGINRGATNKLLNFKDKYDKEMSASGVLGGAQQFKVMEEQEKARFYDFGLKQGYSKGRIDNLWAERTKGRSAFGEEGVVRRDYDGVALAAKIDPVELLDKKKFGFTKGPDGLLMKDSNITQVSAGITEIYNRFANPGSEEHQSMLDQGLTLEDIRNQLALAGASKLVEGIDDSKKFQFEMERLRMDFKSLMAANKANGKETVAPKNPFMQGPSTLLKDDLDETPSNLDELRDKRNSFFPKVYPVENPFTGKVTLFGDPDEKISEENATALRIFDTQINKRIEDYYSNNEPAYLAKHKATYSQGTEEENEFYNKVDAANLVYVPKQANSEELMEAGRKAWPGKSDQFIESKAYEYINAQKKMINTALSYWDQSKVPGTTVRYSTAVEPVGATDKERKAIKQANINSTRLLKNPDDYNIVQIIEGEEEIVEDADEFKKRKISMRDIDPDDITVLGYSASGDASPRIRYQITDKEAEKTYTVDTVITAPLVADNGQRTNAGFIFDGLKELGNTGKALNLNAFAYQRYSDYMAIPSNQLGELSDSETFKKYVQDDAFSKIVKDADAELYRDTSDGKFRMAYKEYNDSFNVIKKVTWAKLLAEYGDKFDYEKLSEENPVLIKNAIDRLTQIDPDIRKVHKDNRYNLKVTAEMLQDAGILKEKLELLRQDTGAVSTTSKTEFMRMVEKQ